MGTIHETERILCSRWTLDHFFISIELFILPIEPPFPGTTLAVFSALWRQIVISFFGTDDSHTPPSCNLAVI